MKSLAQVAWSGAAAALLAGCGAEPLGPNLLDLDGVSHAPLDVQGDDVHVLIFTSHECPIANAYAPTLQALQSEWAERPRVRLFLLHVDPDLSREDARQHARDYQLPGTVLLDPTQAAARACGATITPEAVVRTAQGQVYRGRIDDQWRKLGSRAPAANRRDLAEAVAHALAGRAVPAPHPRAVGCLLPEPRR